MSNLQTLIKVREFYQNAQDIVLVSTPSLFEPDEWTQSLASGVQELNLAGKTVLEVGVGIGINMVGVMTSPNAPQRFIATDIDKRAVKTATNLAKELGLDGAVIGQSDLLASFDGRHNLNPFNPLRKTNLTAIDTIFACIPQIPRQNIDLNDKDNYSHYYKADGSHWDTYSLGLNAKLLNQTPRETGIALNLSGRSGLNVLTRLFKESGRPFEIVHERIIPQHLGTSLASLARMEGNGHEDFEFFADANATIPMNAREAESARLEEVKAGQDHASFHHKIYVMHAPAMR